LVFHKRDKLTTSADMALGQPRRWTLMLGVSARGLSSARTATARGDLEIVRHGVPA
jgi:hypothetical protein